MKIYKTNSGLGYNQYAYFIKIEDCKYLCVYLDYVWDAWDIINMYEEGRVDDDMEDWEWEAGPISFKIEDSPLYGTFLFDKFLESL